MAAQWKILRQEEAGVLDRSSHTHGPWSRGELYDDGGEHASHLSSKFINRNCIDCLSVDRYIRVQFLGELCSTPDLRECRREGKGICAIGLIGVMQPSKQIIINLTSCAYYRLVYYWTPNSRMLVEKIQNHLYIQIHNLHILKYLRGVFRKYRDWFDIYGTHLVEWNGISHAT